MSRTRITTYLAALAAALTLIAGAGCSATPPPPTPAPDTTATKGAEPRKVNFTLNDAGLALNASGATSKTVNQAAKLGATDRLQVNIQAPLELLGARAGLIPICDGCTEVIAAFSPSSTFLPKKDIVVSSTLYPAVKPGKYAVYVVLTDKRTTIKTGGVVTITEG